MIIWTPTVLSVLYASVLYFCTCTRSAQLSMFHMERRCRNTHILLLVVVVVLYNKQILLSTDAETNISVKLYVSQTESDSISSSSSCVNAYLAIPKHEESERRFFKSLIHVIHWSHIVKDSQSEKKLQQIK